MRLGRIIQERRQDRRRGFAAYPRNANRWQWTRLLAARKLGKTAGTSFPTIGGETSLRWRVLRCINIVWAICMWRILVFAFVAAEGCSRKGREAPNAGNPQRKSHDDSSLLSKASRAEHGTSAHAATWHLGRHKLGRRSRPGRLRFTFADGRSPRQNSRSSDLQHVGRDFLWVGTILRGRAAQ